MFDGGSRSLKSTRRQDSPKPREGLRRPQITHEIKTKQAWPKRKPPKLEELQIQVHPQPGGKTKKKTKKKNTLGQPTARKKPTCDISDCLTIGGDTHDNITHRRVGQVAIEKNGRFKPPASPVQVGGGFKKWPL